MQSLVIPTSWIIDAVEAIHGEMYYKRLPNPLDVDALFCSDTYSGESIFQEIREGINGITYYSDTNNSSINFELIPPYCLIKSSVRYSIHLSFFS